MITEDFLKTWYAESLRLSPLRDGEEHSYEDFKSAPIVQACISAMKLNSPSYAHDFLLLETNLQTCLELRSLPAVPRTVIESALRQVQQMKKAEL